MFVRLNTDTSRFVKGEILKVGNWDTHRYITLSGSLKDKSDGWALAKNKCTVLTPEKYPEYYL